MDYIHIDFVRFIPMAIAILIVTFIVTVGVGLGIMTLKKIPHMLECMWNYFSTPTSEKLEFDWFFYKFFELFSHAMGQRWYEARALAYRSVWLSLLCAFGIAQIVRYEYDCTTDDYCRMITKCKVYYFTPDEVLFKDHMKFLVTQAVAVRDELGSEAGGVYQIFVCGKNVVWDFMSGPSGRFTES
ncbi:hypothetical protein [Flavobacterium sp.]|jgi:hypothetical protein|uniref:hypothetical protein n=1 Tax=Flavobacterium sp. TaxID=239 RepID=UPI0037BE8DCD